MNRDQPRWRIRISTLMLLIIIVALALALVVERWKLVETERLKAEHAQAVAKLEMAQMRAAMARVVPLKPDVEEAEPLAPATEAAPGSQELRENSQGRKPAG